MKNATNTSLRNLKCIKVTHNGEREYNISYNKFYRSFVEERWTGERRTGRNATIFGYAHTKTTVKNPFGGTSSVRVFDFPISEEEAIERHEEYLAENII